MAYIYGNRYQPTMLPQSVDEYVSKNDPVRAYDAFAEALELKELGLEVQEVKVGSPAYNPKAMLKLLLYGYSYGIRSSRQLERACHHNISFMWLVEGLRPDHKTISLFRKNNRKSFENIMKQCAKLCIELKLIEGNTLFVDGSKIRASASLSKTYNKERAEKLLKNIDKRIEQILDECDQIDDKEQDDPSLVELGKELESSEALKRKVESIVKELKKSGKDKLNLTDPQCINVKSRQGTHAGYNGQITVDEKHGLIVSSDVVAENNDLNRFAEQIEQANEVLGRKCKNACADAGYANTKELEKIDEQKINVIVPSIGQVSDKRKNPFDKEHFKYDAKKDIYRCPEGKELKYRETDRRQNLDFYTITDKTICQSCKYFGSCTKSKNGRSISRYFNEETRKRLEANYEKVENKQIYDLRKQKVELPFGHIKRNLGAGAFMLKGLASVKAEMAILASCFNMARMITILGVDGLISGISTIKCA